MSAGEVTGRAPATALPLEGALFAFDESVGTMGGQRLADAVPWQHAGAQVSDLRGAGVDDGGRHPSTDNPYWTPGTEFGGAEARTEPDDFARWLEEREAARIRAETRWDTGELVYSQASGEPQFAAATQEAEEDSAGHWTTQVETLGGQPGQTAVAAPVGAVSKASQRFFATAPALKDIRNEDGTVNTDVIDGDYLAEVPSDFRRRGVGGTVTALISPAAVSASRRRAREQGGGTAAVAGAASTAAVTSAALAIVGEASLAAGLGFGGIAAAAPFAGGYILGKRAMKHESLHAGDVDKQSKKIWARIGNFVLAAVAGAGEGALGGLVVTAGNPVGAAIGAVVGMGLGIAGYQLGRNRQRIFLREVGRAWAQETAQTTKNGEGEEAIAKEQAKLLDLYGVYEPGSTAHTLKKDREAEARGPIAAGLTTVGIPAAGALVVEKVAGALTILNAAAVAGAAALAGGALYIGRAVNKSTSKWESRGGRIGARALRIAVGAGIVALGVTTTVLTGGATLPVAIVGGSLAFGYGAGDASWTIARKRRARISQASRAIEESDNERVNAAAASEAAVQAVVAGVVATS